jgi:hypothetical protein
MKNRLDRTEEEWVDLDETRLKDKKFEEDEID